MVVLVFGKSLRIAVLVSLGLFVSLAIPSAARADDDLFGTNKPAATKRIPVLDRIDFKVSVRPTEVKPGETIKLTIEGTPRPGYHTYPITQRTSKQNELQLSRLLYGKNPDVKPLWPMTETEPELVLDEGTGDVLSEFKDTFTWTQEFLVSANATPGEKTLQVAVKLQVCDERNCLPGEIPYDLKYKVSPAPAVVPSADLLSRASASAPPIKVMGGPELNRTTAREPTSVPKDIGAAPKPPATIVVERPSLITQSEAGYATSMKGTGGEIKDTTEASAPTGLWAFMLQGIFWGAVSLVTPCVFPMIPITVSFFLKQSEKANYRPVTMAVVYCLTIVVVLTIAAVALLSFFRWLSVNPYMNFALGLLFVGFALSLFGMYDIELPSGLARFTSSREGQGGLVGVMFMALTFTIVSFACVAPFLGGFGGTAAGSSLTLAHRALGGFAFAATFASPFFILAVFPNLLRKMPKSGSWLNSVKVVMGFLELAAAIKFFRAGELILTPMPALFTYDLGLGMFIALAFLCGLYLLNVYRLPHDHGQGETIGVPRLLFGFLFLSLSFYLVPALFASNTGKQRPAGTIYAWIDSFLLPEPSSQPTQLVWSGDLPQAVSAAREQLKKTGQTQRIFVDFTGETCTNCKWNENNVFTKADIKELFGKYRLVQLYTDKVPDEYYASDLRQGFAGTRRQQADAKVNLDFQREVFGTEQLPLYVILEPQRDGSIRVVNKYEEGKINNADAFARFLKGPEVSTTLSARARTN